MNTPSTKPMAIASIMATPLFPPSPPTSLPYHHHLDKDCLLPRRTSLVRSPPVSPEFKGETSVPSSPQSITSSSSTLSFKNSSLAPLTLQERRLRNKTASAKYRQKKNQQQHEMRQMIGYLSEQNAVLEQQVQELRVENERLKTTTDKLRGKMVAKKMLQQYFDRQQKGRQRHIHLTNHTHSTNIYNSSINTGIYKAKSKGSSSDNNEDDIDDNDEYDDEYDDDVYADFALEMSDSNDGEVDNLLGTT